MPKNTPENRSQRAAAHLEAERRRARNRQLLGVGGVVVVIALIVGVLFFIQQGDEAPAAGESPAPAGADGYSLAVGPDDAPHTVVVYEDFLCPFCGEFEQASRTELADLAEQGQVQVQYRPLDFLGRISDYSLRAANAFAVVLDASGPETAKTFHDSLFENQPSESGPFPEDDALVQLAVDAGADETAVRPGIEGLAFAGWVAEATDAASKAGINGTPTIVLDGEQFSDGETIDELVQNLTAAIQQ